MFNLIVKEEQLPPEFKNLMIQSKSNDQIVIRSNLCNMDEIKKWVAEFSLRTNTKWNAEKSFPNGEKMLCR